MLHVVACPANVNVQAYVALISNGRFKEALDIIRREIPFPAICGRVCFAPCEEACIRNNIDFHIEIRLLKRLVSELEFNIEKNISIEKLSPTQDKKIAIIGGGPAGLTAAYELLKLGYPVTLFERESKLGGMLRLCLPEYRLPEYVLDAEIKYIIDSGVDIKTNVNIGEDLKFHELWSMGFDAIFIATGTPKCSRLNVEGKDLGGVFHALNFLKDVRSKKVSHLNGWVAVIGGGNVAIDCARTAVRLGSEGVIVVYRRVREDMRAHSKEVEEAEEEGGEIPISIHPEEVYRKQWDG
ncbi:MAG: FAD-dependent oxidoreductase [Candidatus Bathyarchaeia archaeon]